jgi:AcrR family transcriptional regulator
VSRTAAPSGRTGRPPVTSRAQILAVARRLIDDDGWERLTIRRLAAEIGVSPTTLYHHVQDKGDLLLLLLHEYADQVPRPELPSEPRDRIVVAATVIHDALAGWTWAAEVLTTDGFLARLGGSAQWLVEVIVAAAIDHGCTPAQAVYVFRSIWYYTVGEILVRAHSARWRSEDEPPTDRDAFPVGASDLPRLAAIGDQWVPLAAQDTYPQGLRAFVDGLLAQGVT